MGYDLNIIRDKDNRISLQEWQNYLSQDSEFKRDWSSTKTQEGWTNSETYSTFWLSENGEIEFTFYEGRGEITVKSPEQWIIDKMIQISETLKAQVIGEEGEVYSKANPQGMKLETKIPVLKEQKKKWWQFFWKTKPTKKEFPYERMIGANFHYEKNKDTFDSLLAFLKKLNDFPNMDIIRSSYHFEDVGLLGTIKDIEKDQEFKVGVILDTTVQAEDIMIVSNKNSYSISFSIYDDLQKLVNLINLIGNEENLLLGSVYNAYDNKWQSETTILFYEANNKKFNHLNFKKDVFGNKCIDTSYHSGRTIFGGGLSFIAGWKNWFGPKLLKKLPVNFWENPIFIDFAIQENGIVITQLHENPLDQNLERTIRQKQHQLLQILGIEQILKKYEKEKKEKFNKEFKW